MTEERFNWSSSHQVDLFSIWSRLIYSHLWAVWELAHSDQPLVQLAWQASDWAVYSVIALLWILILFFIRPLALPSSNRVISTILVSYSDLPLFYTREIWVRDYYSASFRFQIKASNIFSTFWKFCGRWQIIATHLFCQQIDRYRREAEENKNRLYEFEADSQRKQQENALENEKVHNLCHPWTQTPFCRQDKKSEQSWVCRSSGAKLRKRCGRVARTFYSVYSYFKWC